MAGVSALTCSPDGSCLALASLGAVPNFTLVGLRSADGGKTWTAGPPTTYRSGGGSMFSACGDASHCMAAFSSDSRAGGIVIATTANQGATWSVSPAPPTWDNLATALSCATGLDCSVATTETSSNAGFTNPVIEATTDGGASWGAFNLSKIGDTPVTSVFALSCPSSAGCVGVGTGNGSGSAFVISSLKRSGPAAEQRTP